MADQVARNAQADLAAGHLRSAGTKFLRASGYYLAAGRMRSRDQAVNSPKRHPRIFTKAGFEVELCGTDNGTGMRDHIADTFAETG